VLVLHLKKEIEAVITGIVVLVITLVVFVGVGLEIVDGFFFSIINSGHDHVHQRAVLVHGEDMEIEGEKVVVDEVDHSRYSL